MFIQCAYTTKGRRYYDWSLYQLKYQDILAKLFQLLDQLVQRLRHFGIVGRVNRSDPLFKDSRCAVGVWISSSIAAIALLIRSGLATLPTDHRLEVLAGRMDQEYEDRYYPLGLSMKPSDLWR